MTQRHKHADVIIAWANGAEVEYRGRPTASWVSAGVLNDLGWYENYEYRVKPPAKKYRVALLKDSLSSLSSESYALATNDQAYADTIEHLEDFVRWLTDWIEYEE